MYAAYVVRRDADMADNEFEANLVRSISASLLLLVGMQVARDMFGKSYFSLGAAEKAAVDSVTVAQVGANYSGLTPEYLKGQATTQPKSAAGFPTQMDEKKS
jgi:hypothetical protein